MSALLYTRESWTKWGHEPELAFVRWFTPTERPAHAVERSRHQVAAIQVGEDHSQRSLRPSFQDRHYSYGKHYQVSTYATKS